VAETDHQETAHEETIVPVKPGLARFEPVAATTERDHRRDRPRLLVGTALVVSLLLALAVIFVLENLLIGLRSDLFA